MPTKMTMNAPALRRLVRLSGYVAAFLVMISLPLFLITASIGWSVNDQGLYRRGFERYDVSIITRITGPDLIQAGAEIRGYFNSRQEPLSVQTKIRGIHQELFNRREVLHMADVKRLIWWVYGMAAATGGYLLLITLAGLAWKPKRHAPILAKLYLSGGVLTLGLLLMVGLLSLGGFDRLFLMFHQISFSNDLWQLNQNTDYLLMMFPAPFWFYATVWVATFTVAGALVAMIVSGGYLFTYSRSLKKEAE
jgi:integral membrane protein (TIGR01906 family)